VKTDWVELDFDLAVEDATSGQPKTKQTDYLEVGSIPLVDQGKEVIGGFTDDKGALSTVPLPAIVFGDHTRCIKYIDFAFGAGADGVKILRPRPGVDARYLYHVLCALKIPNAGYSRHFKFLRESRLPIPPIEEQRRIASILDAADALRTKRRQALAKLDTLTQAIFIDMFGGMSGDPSVCSPLAELVAHGDRINYGVVQPGNDAVDGVPMIRVGDLVAGRVSHRAVKRIDADIDSQYSRSRLLGDEILLSCVGSAGVVALASPQEEGWNIARAVARIPLMKSIERDYVAAFLSSPIAQRYFDNELRTVSQPTLNIKQIKETPIPIPPLRAQAEFVIRVKSVRQAQDFQRMHLDRLDALFASLQHRAFRGQL